jgi:hypothetical protein
MRAFKFWAATVIAFLLSGSVAFAAADAVDPLDGSTDLARAIYDAFSGHHYAYCAALGMILGVALLKRAGAHYLGQKAVDFLHGDIGGTLLTLVGSTATAMASSLAGGGPATWALLKTSTLVGVGAVGGYSVIKKLIIPMIIKPLQARLPAWAQPILNAALWFFDKPAAAAQVEADASKAGDAAVAADPGKGVEASIGKPDEVK